MDIPTKMELVWKPKMITRLIGGMVGDMCLEYGFVNRKHSNLGSPLNESTNEIQKPNSPPEGSPPKG